MDCWGSGWRLLRVVALLGVGVGLLALRSRSSSVEALEEYDEWGKDGSSLCE